ncbi:MAG: hypothetical protein V3V22_06745 [Methylococcales bacterium]
MLGAVSIGNATIIVLDDVPILATDPWIGDEDEAYFGSWRLSHKIPSREKNWISEAKYHWYSHGHPDHLNPHSINRFTGTTVLLADHVGGRIKQGLIKKGLNVQVLPDREWVGLSSNVRVMSICDYLQDAILLIDINGRLFVNANDAGLRGSKRFVRKIANNYSECYLLKLSGYGDADMINLFDANGDQIKPYAAQKPSVGRQLTRFAKALNCNFVIPSSSFHQYAREDSVWAEQYTTPIDAYKEGFDHSIATYVDPFVFINCESGEIIPICPEKNPQKILKPADFGDDWAELLDSDDKKKIDRYFRAKELIVKNFGFLKFVVGGNTYTLSLNGPKDKGIAFEVPRNSLMICVDYAIFDDLLIGNFMRTTLYGVDSLYDPNFGHVVAKFADNGNVQTESEVRDYMNIYKTRAQGDWLLHILERDTNQVFRKYVDKDSILYRGTRSVYRMFR